MIAGKGTKKKNPRTSYKLTPILVDEPKEGVARLLDDIRFDYGMGVVILLNAVVIGVETDQQNNADIPPAMWEAIELCFLVVFTVEIGLRAWAMRRDFFLDRWCWFDSVLVLFATADRIVSATGAAGQEIRAITVLRVLRLLRLCRVLRLLRIFKELWLLTNGVLQSFRTLFWASILMLLMIYCGAVFMTQIVITTFGNGDSAPDIEADVLDDINLRWGNVGRSVFSLFQIMTLEGWSEEFCRPLMGASPHIWIFFVGFLMCSTFALLNIVTSIIVETTFSQVKKDDEEFKLEFEREREVLVHALQSMFEHGDVNGNGQLSFDEFLEALQAPEVFARLQQIGVSPEEAIDLFKLLDADMSGELSINEFTIGVLRIKGDAKTRDVLTLQYNVHMAIQEQGNRLTFIEDSITRMYATQETRHEELLQLLTSGPSKDTSHPSSTKEGDEHRTQTLTIPQTRSTLPVKHSSPGMLTRPASVEGETGTTHDFLSLLVSGKVREVSDRLDNLLERAVLQGQERKRIDAVVRRGSIRASRTTVTDGSGATPTPHGRRSNVDAVTKIGDSSSGSRRCADLPGVTRGPPADVCKEDVYVQDLIG